jgi:ABC-type multidrug transport system fused ATPase/permease subunit
MDLIIDATKPVVIIAATGPFILSFYNRSIFLITRLRQYNKELLEKKNIYDNATRDIMLEQLKKLNKHAKLLTYSIVLLLLSVLSNLLTCFFVGFHTSSSTEHSRRYEQIGYIFFNLGIVMFFVAIVISLFEIITHLNPVMIEEKKIRELLELDNIDSTLVLSMDVSSV